MTMDTTPRWNLPMLFAGQAQKELFHNEALVRIDMLLHGRAQSAMLNAPPASPAPGACWIVAAGGSGAWAGKDGQVACWSEGGWRYVVPRAGLTLAIADVGETMHHDGAAWRSGNVRADGLYVEEDRVVSVRQAAIADPTGGGVIDDEARFSIAAILSSLRAHGLIHT